MKRMCPICNRKYVADPDRLKYGRQTTCSRKCSYRLRATKLSKRVTIKCQCGKEFVALPRRQFCSKKCQYKFYVVQNPNRPKGQRVFYKYKCGFCKADFSPRHPRTEPRVFCSRKCYENQKSLDMAGENNPMFGKSPKFVPSSWKQGWYTVGGKRCFFRSSWEVSVAFHLEEKGYDWRYELKRYKLRDDLTYVPDFFIMNGDEIEKIVEVKGWLKPKDKLKIELFARKHTVPLEVWDRKKLKELDLLDANSYGRIH